MAKKKKPPAEFRFYEVPQGEEVLALMGQKWIQLYGENIDWLHFHNLLEIGLCHYGTGDLIIEKEEYRFDGNMISFIPANILHTTNSDPGVYGFWEYLFVDPEKIIRSMCHGNREGEKELLGLVNRKAFFLKESEAPGFSVLLRQIFEEMREKKAFRRESVKALVYAMLLEAARENSKEELLAEQEVMLEKRESVKLAKAVDFVKENYKRNIKVAELAETCYMSETHFRRFFQERMHITPTDYINFVRIKKACELIDNTDLGMEEIAERVGFSTPSTFNRNFRKIMDTSPYQWKKRPDNYRGKLADYKISVLKGW